MAARPATALVLLAALAPAGCHSLNGSGTMYLSPTVHQPSVEIQRVAVVPNRLPINLKDLERWRRYNWNVLRREFSEHGIEVIDYEATVRAFEQSGLPMDDNRPSREKYAELARSLDVDAIIVPYYGTLNASNGSILIDHSFNSVASFQVYLRSMNGFFARIDCNGEHQHRSGAAFLTSLLGSGISIITAAIPFEDKSTPIEEQPIVLTTISLANLTSVFFAFLVDAVSGVGTPKVHWEDAFNAGIHEGLKPLFAMLGPPKRRNPAGGAPRSTPPRPPPSLDFPQEPTDPPPPPSSPPPSDGGAPQGRDPLTPR